MTCTREDVEHHCWLDDCSLSDVGAERLASMDRFIARGTGSGFSENHVLLWARGHSEFSDTDFSDVDETVLHRVVERRLSVMAPIGGRGGPISAEAFLTKVANTGGVKPDWLIPGTLCSSDRVILTGSKGAGKSTLSLQIGVQSACGIHPWTGEKMDPISVLYVDCENPIGEHEERLQRMLRAAGSHLAEGHFRFHSTDSRAWDLGDPDEFEILKEWVEKSYAELLIIGPLYKLNLGNTKDENIDRRLSDNFDQLRSLECAVMIEAHTTKSQNSMEPSGSDVWTRWAEYGFHLSNQGKLTPFREPRRRGVWPTRLERSDPWPWVVANSDSSATHLSSKNQSKNESKEFAEIVLDYLSQRPGQEVTKTNLPASLRLNGVKCRDRSIGEALELLVKRGSILSRSANRATYYFYPRMPLGDLI
jgi:hypothetical protein